MLEQELARKRTIDEVDGRAPSPAAQRQERDDTHSDAENEKQDARFDKVITYAGRTYAIMNAPFLSRSFTFDAKLREDWRNETGIQFANSDNIAQGELHDVLALTAGYEEERKEVKFEDTVSSGHGVQACIVLMITVSAWAQGRA